MISIQELLKRGYLVKSSDNLLLPVEDYEIEIDNNNIDCVVIGKQATLFDGNTVVIQVNVSQQLDFKVYFVQRVGVLL